MRHGERFAGSFRESRRYLAFSVVISNTDDHLRNHGFLRQTPTAWSLSPAFDLNPVPTPGRRYLTTAINYTDTEAEIELMLSVADMFRLGRAQALEALSEVAAATSRWAQVAGRLGQTKSQIDQMAPAFEHPQAKVARALTA